MNHIGLFEGIGGFSLAARWAGWNTPVMVEWNPYCQAVLKKNFPNATIFGDIHEFDGRPYAGQFDILTGGFPCQPYSHAGKRAGNDDDRALWPQMLRIITEIKPSWVVGENVAGLITMDGGRVLSAILSDLENAGYSPEIYSIPAISVGAPHERERIWIVAHSGNARAGSISTEIDNDRWTERKNRTASIRQTHGQACASGAQSTVTNGNNTTPYATWRGCDRRPHDERQEPSSGDRIAPNCICDTSHAGKQRFQRSEQCGTSCKRSRTSRPIAKQDCNGRSWTEHWFEVATRLCRMDDGIPTGMDGTGDISAAPIQKTKGKSHRLEALGNAIVPHIAFEIFEAIKQYDYANLRSRPKIEIRKNRRY